jgi:hypothetical protein
MTRTKRIRMKRVPDASPDSLIGFVQETIEPGSTVCTDVSASELMPRVHRTASLLKRWILGTHQGAVSHEHAFACRACVMLLLVLKIGMLYMPPTDRSKCWPRGAQELAAQRPDKSDKLLESC